jgi:hypothetical protein
MATTENVQEMKAEDVRRGDRVWAPNDHDWLLVDRISNDGGDVTFFRRDYSEADFRVGCTVLVIRDEPTRELDYAKSEPYSKLAWEFARRANWEATGGGGVKASTWVGAPGSSERRQIDGVGPTTTEAMRALAIELDRWSENESRRTDHDD